MTDQKEMSLKQIHQQQLEICIRQFGQKSQIPLNHHSSGSNHAAQDAACMQFTMSASFRSLKQGIG